MTQRGERWCRNSRPGNSSELPESPRNADSINQKSTLASLEIFLGCSETSRWRLTLARSSSATLRVDSFTQDSRVLELIFSVYRPHDLGIVDYHGPHRTYTREQLGGINLNVEAAEQQQRQSALYDPGNKYQNLKSEMASAFVRQLLAREAGLDPGLAEEGDDLLTTLQELFRTFFPSKEFLGISPTQDGRILFPVRPESGHRHDIDYLSSGEKEVLYGYLRLRSTAPKNSVLLLDEPELHLNPRLIRGLAQFYREHLSRRLGNQLWMVTHSDTLLRFGWRRGVSGLPYDRTSPVPSHEPARRGQRVRRRRAPCY